MSLPQLTYSCDRCGTRWGDDTAPREYRVPGGEMIPVKSRLGWCNTCASLVAIQDLDDAGAIIADLERILPRSRSSAQSRPGTWNFFRKQEKQVEDFDLKIWEITSAIKRLGLRKMTPKCLRCGSIGVTGFDVPFEHPGCGGTIGLDRSGPEVRVSFDFANPLVYDPDGNLVGRLKPTVGDLLEKQRDVFIESKGVPITPNLPDVRNIHPARAFHCGKDYWIFLAKDAKPHAESSGAPHLISFPYTMTLIDMGRHVPLCYVTLEKGLGGASMLCMFDDTGGHHNLGSGAAYEQESAFVENALAIVRKKFGVHPIEVSRPA